MIDHGNLFLRTTFLFKEVRRANLESIRAFKSVKRLICGLLVKTFSVLLSVKKLEN